MTHPSCSPLPTFLMETVILPPYEEAGNRISYAFFQNHVKSVDPDFEGPSLIERVQLVVEGLVLMIPLVNWVAFLVMQSYSYTLTERFHAAMEAGDDETVSFYLNMGLNPNTLGVDGKLPVFKALESGNFETLCLLLKYGADTNVTDREGTLFLHALIENASYESYAIAKDAIRLYRADPTRLNAKGETLLQRLYDTNYSQFLLFVNEGLVDPNLLDKHQDTILHHILKRSDPQKGVEDTNSLPAILNLVDKGADLNIRCASNQQTPLWMAYQALGPMAATALIRSGADPNKPGDKNELYPGASNIFQVAWDLKDSFPFFWITALKHGAKRPKNFTEGDVYAVCTVLRKLEEIVIRELYFPKDRQAVDSDQLRKKRAELLVVMNENEWDTFTQFYQRKGPWGPIWIDLLEQGVKPPQQGRGSNHDQVIKNLFNAHIPEEENILLKMQESGWDVVRLAFEYSKDAILFMLLKKGAKPSPSINQYALIQKVVNSKDSRETIPIMMENRWDLKRFCDTAVRDKNYPVVHFMIEMGMEVPSCDWRVARDVWEYRTLITSIPDIIPQGSPRYLQGDLQDTFLGQLFENVHQYNASSNQQKINLLEILLFIHSQEGIKRLIIESSFEEFSHLLTNVVMQYPHINVEWFWKDLFTIPATHFRNYATVKGGRDALPKIPYPLKMDLLLPFFDRINFTDPEKPYYKDESARKDHGIVYSPQDIRSGLEDIIRKIRYRLSDPVANAAPDIDAYYRDQEKHLLAVVYYLQLQMDAKGNLIPDPQNPGKFIRESSDAKAPLNGIKANVLIDLGRTGKMCSGRWKEIMYQCRCRLSGQGEQNLPFVDQIRTLWANKRYVLFSGMTVDTHTHDNLMYHLKESRGIRGDKPARLDHYGQYSTPGSKRDAIAAFDRLGYHPEMLIDMLWEQGVDFEELMSDWIQDNLAQAANLPCDAGLDLRSLRALARVKGYTDQYLPYADIEQLFQQYDSTYALGPQSYDIEGFFKRMSQEKHLKPLASIFQLPDISVMAGAFQDLILAKEQQIDAIWKVFLTEANQERYDELKQLKIEAETEWAKAQEVLESSLKEEKRFLEYQNVVTRAEGVRATPKDQEALNQFILHYAPPNYKELEERVRKLRAEWRTLCPMRQLTCANPSQLEQLQKILQNPHLKTNQVLFQQGALGRELSALKAGSVSPPVMKRAFQDQAMHIKIKKEQTFADFLKTPEVHQLRQVLGKSFVDRELSATVDLSRRLITDPEVKRLIAGLYTEVVFSIAPKPFHYYLEAFHKERFASIMRPQRDTGEDVFKRKLNPLVVYQMLVELGELRYKEPYTFQGAFDTLPSPV